MTEPLNESTKEQEVLPLLLFFTEWGVDAKSNVLTILAIDHVISYKKPIHRVPC